MVQPDRSQMWCSRTGHRCGAAGQVTDVVQPDRSQMAVQYGTCALYAELTEAAETSSERVIITAFPAPQWSRERASMLRYTYIACIVNCYEI